MSLLMLLLLVVCSILVLWAVQSLLLFLHKENFAVPLRFESERPGVRYPMKAMVHLLWAAIVTGYPSLIGSGPIAYFQAAFATPPPWKTMTLMMSLVLTGFAVVNIVGFLSSDIKIGPRYSAPRIIRKVIASILTAVPIAIFEETVFRGVVLSALLSALPASTIGKVIAILISSVLFSSVHFIKLHRPDKAMLQPAIGLFFVGNTLGTAYVTAGQTLWLPIATHAAGILSVEIMRPFVIYQGNHSFLVGYRSTPHSGILGISLMFGLCILLATQIIRPW